MFRIRRVFDALSPSGRGALTQVARILKEQFPAVAEEEVHSLPEKLRNPLKTGFQSVLFTAEGHRSEVRGFALVLHDPVAQFAFLDYIAAGRFETGRGVGSALYERVREEALALGCVGLFFECLPDDPALSPNPSIRRQNAARLRFYENYGARPIAGTAYETPLEPGGSDPPYLVFDDLGQGRPLRREKARQVVREILQKKYGHLCSPEYNRRILASFRDDPVRLRPFRYVFRDVPVPAVQESFPRDRRIFLVVSEGHEIHHVRERGYVEAPVRIRSILRELLPTEAFELVPPRRFGEEHLRAVHDGSFFDYLKKVCAGMEEGKSLYPYVFPIRNAARPPRDLPTRAGYYCIDTFTPLNRNAFLAARRAVDCALTCARALLHGTPLAYALVRPPGHHAERRAFGGFCYFNNAAVAAHYLSGSGRVAVLDVDYHHGNGTQNIFYTRCDVFTTSIHGHPNLAYPYFSGFAEERGEGEGMGYNLNVPLPEKVDGERYDEALTVVLRRIESFSPSFLVVSLGLDGARNDPTGSWDLTGKDFERNGRRIASLRLPTLVVQEGGYDNRVLGSNARSFFRGLWEGYFGSHFGRKGGMPEGMRSDVAAPCSDFGGEDGRA